MITLLTFQPHSSTISGGHKRFDRLCKFFKLSPRYKIVILTSDYILVDGVDRYEIRTFPQFIRNFLPISLLFAITLLLNYKLIRSFLPSSSSLAFCFGETSLLSLVFSKFLFNLNVSFGLRSDVMTLRSQDSQNYILHSFFFKRYFVFLTNLCDQVIVQTNRQRERHIRLGDIVQNKIFVIPNDIPIEPQITLFSRKQIICGELKLLFIGNGTLNKGLDILIKALSTLNKTILDKFSLSIVGVNKNSVDPIFIKQLDNIKIVYSIMPYFSDLSSAYKNNDLLVVPSRSDAFPNVVLEALAYGLPSIGSNVDGNIEIFGSDEYLFPVGDYLSLAQLLSNMLNTSNYDFLCNHLDCRIESFLFDWEKLYSEKLLELLY